MTDLNKLKEEIQQVQRPKTELAQMDRNEGEGKETRMDGTWPTAVYYSSAQLHHCTFLYLCYRLNLISGHFLFNLGQNEIPLSPNPNKGISF